MIFTDDHLKWLKEQLNNKERNQDSRSLITPSDLRVLIERLEVAERSQLMEQYKKVMDMYENLLERNAEVMEEIERIKSRERNWVTESL